MVNDLINYINGDWEKTSKSKIPLYDAGFLLGDGLFETIRFENRQIFRCEKHLDRLFSSLKLIRINCNKSKSEINLLLKEIINKNSLKNGLLRLMITRGIVEGAPWKYKGPQGIYISIRPLTPKPKVPVKIVYYSEKKYPIIRYEPAIKSLNYIGNMLAKKDAEKENAYEPVFYNENNFITECAIRNIFFIKDNSLLTPNIKLGVLPGVMRDTIITIGKEMNLEVMETTISLNEINQMDEAFISSTGIGLLPCVWDGWKSHFKLTFKIEKQLNKKINNNF